MKQFRLKTEIYEYNLCSEFCRSFGIGSGDLIISSGHIYGRYLKASAPEAAVVDIRKYGSGEPDDKLVEAAYRDIREIPFKRVIAVGGGSILDVAKLFSLKRVAPVSELFQHKIELIKEKELVLVPTTCGTGSEVTNISILGIASMNTKLGLAGDELFADQAVLIPELLESLPALAFGASSADALIHAVESGLSPRAGQFTWLYSGKAIEMILEGYKVIAENGFEASKPLLKDFLTASTYAGIAFGNAGVGAVHAMSYPLGSAFHIPHGESNYALFAGVLRMYEKLVPGGKMRRLQDLISDILGCNYFSAFDELEALMSRILPRRELRSYGVTESDLQDFTQSVMNKQGRLMANNYTELTKEHVYHIYKSVY